MKLINFIYIYDIPTLALSRISTILPFLGESILVCTTTTKPHGITLVQSSLPNVRSALIGYEGALTSSMKRALLEVIASGIATRPEDVHKYARATLLSKSIDMGLFDADGNCLQLILVFTTKNRMRLILN